jgi:hypothetical protein
MGVRPPWGATAHDAARAAIASSTGCCESNHGRSACNPHKTKGSSWFRTSIVTSLAAIALAASPAALAGPKGTDRALKGECDATFTVIGFGPPLETLQLELACEFNHLGPTTGSAVQVVNVGAFPFAINTTIVYVADNGDQLYATFAGVGYPSAGGTAVAFTGTTTYDGGTGRFADASGTSTDSGEASLLTNEGHLAATGKISS